MRPYRREANFSLATEQGGKGQLRGEDDFAKWAKLPKETEGTVTSAETL
jgi:hypothetical protein